MPTKNQNADLALAQALVQKYEELIPLTKANGALELATMYEKYLATTRLWIANTQGANS
jgi:hypothetical protein